MSAVSDGRVDALLTNPLCRPEHLGAPIPDSPHAVSVCLPTWQDNVGYEEADPRVVDRLRAGYPRFVYHPLCRQLFAECLRRFGQPGEACLAFPSPGSAGRFSDWMMRRASLKPRVVEVGTSRVCAVFFPQSAAAEAKAFWQHSGEGVSSRLAETTLRQLTSGETASRPLSSGGDSASDPKTALRQRVAQYAGVAADDVYLFPCGMNSAWQLHRAVLNVWPDRRSAQFGFPYVDTLKIQQKLGPGAAFFPRGDAADFEGLARLLEGERLSAIYTELPSNPLLLTPDLGRIAELARRREALLVVDDTIGASVNVDALPVADVLWVSLTKFFSGAGDVTGGAVMLNRRSRFYERMKESLAAVYEDLVFADDAAVLERNSRDFEPRVRAINANAEALADHLVQHPLVARIHYPKFCTPDLYRSFLRPGGGYGGLMSIEVKAAGRAAAFFDALAVCKGPNLGMSYTLACPYTILAHYTELDFAEACGVSRHLVRVSVGTEPAGDLIARFDDALRATR